MKIKLLITLFLYLCISSMEKAHGQTQPVITSFTPLASRPGTSVTLTGSNFNTTTANNIVYFGAVRATVTAASATSLTVTVPANATHSPISVLNTGTNLSGYSLKYFLPKFTPVRPSALSTGDFTLTGHISSPAYGMASADLDDDGKPEIITTGNAPGDDKIYIRQNISTASTISFGAVVNNTATGTDRLEGKPSIGDIDGDGRPDIVTPGRNTDNFAVLLNTGSLSGFTSSVFATGDEPTATDLGDFDGDGKIDVVVSNYGDQTISVFLNTSSPGSVSFAAVATFTTVGSVATLVVADFNGDGKPDVLGTRGTSNLIRVFQNSSAGVGSINFSESDITVMQHPSSLTAGDMDSDGDLDLIVTSEDNATTNFGILTNTSGAGITFTFQQIDVGSNQSHAALADLNGDGKADILLGLKKDFGSFTYRLAVLTNTTTTGAITVSPRIELAAQRSPITVIAADMNGDGRPDLLSSNAQVETVTVYRNTLQYPPAITTFSPAKAAPGTSVTLTGSGFNSTIGNNVVYFGPVKAIVTAASASSLTVTVPFGATHSLISVLNTGTGMSGLSLSTFLPVFTPNKQTLRAADIAARATITTIAGAYTVTAADFDGDGKQDLLTNSSNTELRIHPNTSSAGTFSFGTATNLTSNNGARYTGIGDVDGDGKLDIAVPNLVDNNVSIFRNSSSGTISFDAKVDIVTGNAPVACIFADLDGDGRPELVVSNYNESTISVFRNTTLGGIISFDPKVDFTVGVSPVALSVNDFDGDGKLDIAVGVRVANKVAVLRNTGSGTIDFATPSDLAVGGTAWMIQSGDVDGDGKPDLAASNISGNNIVVYRNISTSGNTAFENGVNYPVVFARGFSLGDINGDGRPDMVAASEANNTLSVFANSSSSGSISFATPIGLSVPAGSPSAVILADLDGDSRSDIAAAEGASTAISLFHNALVAAPTVQASNVSFSSTTATSTTINWTSGNGDSRIVWMKADNTGTPAPVDESSYTANSAFGSGSQIDATGWYAVYKGTGSSESVTGLTAVTDYRVMVTEYNGTGGLELYQRATATNNPVLLTTASTDATLSGLSLSSGSLSPVFASATTSYNATVSPGTTSISVTPTASQGNASIEVRVNGGAYAAVGSGAASSALSLNNGTNTIDVKVTAQDGSTIKTYTVTVIRQINQVITFSGTASMTYGTADFDPGATSSNTGIVLTYVSSDPAIATIVAGKVHIIKTGTVNITASQAGDGTYVAAPDKIQALTVQPKSITLVLNASPAITKTYDGNTAVTLASGNYSLSGVETGDGVTVSGTTLFDTKDAGTGKTVTANSLVLAGAQKDNYSLSTTSATTTGSIIAKNITASLSASPIVIKTYNGTNAATLAAGNYILSGIEAGDQVTVSGTASFDNKNVGATKSVTATGLVLAGSQKGNYALSNTTAVSTGNITAKSITLTLSSIPVITKPYNGASSAATLVAGNYILNGVETGDEVGVSGTASFNNQNAGIGKTVTANNFVLEGAQKDNYSLTTTSATTTGNITAKSITLSLNSSPAIIKTYDGTNAVSLAEANYALNGIITGDAVKVSGTASYDNKNAGTGKTVTAGNFMLSGAQKDNYILSTLNASTNGTIEKKILTVRADDQLKRQDEANPVFTLSYSGFVSGESTGDLSVLPVAWSTASLASAPGTYPITPGGSSTANYSVIYVNGILTIVPSAFVNTAPTLDAIPDRAICYTNAPQTISLTGITAGAGDISQYTNLTVSTTNSGLFSSLIVTKGTNGAAVLTYVAATPTGGTARVTVTVSDDGGTANGGSDSFSRSFDLTISSLPQARINSDSGTTVSKGSTVILTASGGTSYTWATAHGIISGQNTGVLSIRPLQNTTYTVTASSGSGCTSVQSITISVLDDYKMVASNFLTPNGDGKNDTWVIKNIDAYPNNQVTVFDAAGRPVYQKKGYNNSQGWGGDVNGSLLTEGSYFYVIDFGGGEEVFKGFITILKDR